MPEGTDAVILELGANDMLRGIDPKVTRAALDEIIRRLKARGIAVLLCGMLAPPNLGADYARAFDAIYPELAAAHVPSLSVLPRRRGRATPKLNQRDGLHPTAAGIAAIVARILPKVEEPIGAACGPSDLTAIVTDMPHVQIQPRIATRVTCNAPPVHRSGNPRRHLAESLSMLRGGMPGARWIDPENYHLTLRFIGDVDDALAGEVASLLGQVRRRGFELRLDGLVVVRRPQAARGGGARSRHRRR